MNLVSVLFVFGLTLDILGAYFLAQGFITKNLDDLTFEGTSGYASPPNLRYIKSNLYQKAEAQIGFVFLMFGFILQSFDYFVLTSDHSLTVSPCNVILSIIGLVAISFVSAKFIRARLFASYAKKMARIVVLASKPEAEWSDSWITTVDQYLLPRLIRAS